MATYNSRSATAPRFSTLARSNPSNATVILEVGEKKTRFHVTKPLLTHHSDYFDRALNGRWKESDDNVIVLEDVEVSVMKIFIDWLHTQELPEDYKSWADEQEPPLDDEDYGEIELLKMKLYVFADRFMVPDLYRMVWCDIVSTHSCCVPEPEVIFYAFDNLCVEDRMLDFLVDRHCGYWSPPKEKKTSDRVEQPNLLEDAKAVRLKECQENLPREFLFKAMETFARRYKRAVRKGDVRDYKGPYIFEKYIPE